MKNKIIQGDCLEVLKTLDDNSVDSIVTDPPYELGFMGKSWDNTGIANNKEMWAECLRVLKPGGHLLAFSGTRTYHRMAVAIEDAGFEVRDQIANLYDKDEAFRNFFDLLTSEQKKAFRRFSDTEAMLHWCYGSGFPKSLNIGKAVARLEGKDIPKTKGFNVAGQGIGLNPNRELRSDHPNYVKPTFDNEYDGWGTALKPSHEPICLARKPLDRWWKIKDDGKKVMGRVMTVAENCLKWGTGGINIDESRVETTDKLQVLHNETGEKDLMGNMKGKDATGRKIEFVESGLGRFPANLIHDNSEEVRECFPESTSGARKAGFTNKETGYEASSYEMRVLWDKDVPAEKGNASRFFKSIIYQAKSSKSDRNKGLDCYLTVKYNGSIINNNKTLCKEENMVAVQLLQKVMSEQELVSFNIDESGVNIMAQCHKDSLSIILTEINRIIGLKIYSSLMHSLTNESTQVANSEMEVGGSLAENVVDLKRWILTTTKGNQELALGASRVVCEMLQLISVEENWKEKTNTHATVKPIALMEYLIKMITPKGGIVLDPFAGSGSTLVAAKQNGFHYIGIEMEADYIKIAEARLQAVPNKLF